MTTHTDITSPDEPSATAERPARALWGPHEEPIAAEGWPYLGAAIVLAVVLFLAAGSIGLLLGAGVAAFVAFFFRNPERIPPDEPGAIISPADGRVVAITDDATDPLQGNSARCIGVFMSGANVHVNRAPMAGTVTNIGYRPGRFHPAASDAATLENERNCVTIEDADGRRVTFVQVAGIVARRIVCYLTAGMEVGCGQRVGLIRFGSRVDVYVPTDAQIVVEPGDKVRAGTSILAYFPVDEADVKADVSPQTGER